MRKSMLVAALSLFIAAPPLMANTKQSNEVESAIRRERSMASKDFNAFVSGDTSVAESLKTRANKGDRWAAMTYGYMAHTGMLTGKPDLLMAHKAYKLAAVRKRPDGGIINRHGNYLAAYNLGLMYYHGWGVPKNGALALMWFEASVYKTGQENGQVFYPSAAMAARIYRDGYGVRADDAQAYKYWKIAAKSQDPTALGEIGRMEWQGKGTEKNEFSAITNLRRAANGWNVDAMYLLAQALMTKTRFQEPDPVTAAKWLLIAGSKRPAYMRDADKVMRNMTPTQRTTISNAAASWMRSRSNPKEPFDYSKPVITDPKFGNR